MMGTLFEISIAQLAIAGLDVCLGILFLWMKEESADKDEKIDLLEFENSARKKALAIERGE